MSLSIVILAAGQGTRMRSALPKVLHPLGGQPLLAHVIETARALRPERILVVYGHGGEQVRTTLADAPVEWIEQTEQLGTGHAVDQAMPAVPDEDSLLVLYADVPLIRADTLAALVHEAEAGRLAVLTAELDEPAGYGRMLRDRDGRLSGIVEHKDATPEQRAIREINTGFLAAPAARLRGWLAHLDNANAQGEYYLTDVLAMAVADGVEVAAVCVQDADEILGVNDRIQLAHLERVLQDRHARTLMREGVTLADPARIDIRGSLRAGQDCVIDINVVFEGEVELGRRVHIGPGCVIRDTRIGDDVQVQAHCVIEQAQIGRDSRIGPFARIRPETRLAEGVHVGNFVEIKKSDIDQGSKINHLSYIGDTHMGRAVNIGAGTITCNYDGARKHRTDIGNRVFVGSDTQLVAPVKVGDGATIGAGSTITRDVPAEKLTLSRVSQKTIEGWQRPVKNSGKRKD
ncbi:MAG TPA: UDP-N-acetylglucosamine diphosphorylase/glucosamine-1-phosphate N-acetyltransferase [Gammaproteobacteria bacterium]|nr:UDP-N-acetylglucosamine diphosphorylase/glucosamine-1-phosphate N-acetyltransferase [Gammaproteobacteria bacterium]